MLGMLLVSSGRTDAGVLYVDDNASPGGNGQNWNTAFRCLQDALAAAQPGSGVTEIRVAQGVYLPDRTEKNPAGTGDRDAHFAMISGVALRGGYLGLSATRGLDPNSRDIAAYQTILSGDLAGDDPAPPPPGTLPSEDHFTNAADNAYQVVVAIEVDESAVLDGFTVTAGHADGIAQGATPDSRDQGSGLNIYFASPTVTRCTFLRNYNANHGAVNDHGDNSSFTDCTFRANYSLLLGAGLYSHFHSSTTANRCTFLDNFTEGDGGGGYSRSTRFAIYTNCEFQNNRSLNKGGGMYNSLGSATVMVDCHFQFNQSLFGGGVYCDDSTAMLTGLIVENNVAESQGGGMYNNLGSPTIADSQFIANDAPGGGAGMWCADSNASITQCTFRDNTSLGGGAGMYNVGGQPTVDHCVFQANISEAAGGGLWTGQNSSTVSNCLFQDNFAQSGGGMYASDQATPTVDHCTFLNNHAQEGGGLSNFASNSVVLDCAFTGNMAVGGGFPVGGGVLNYFCDPVIKRCVFDHNIAELGGGAIYNEFNSPTIIDCVMRRNLAVGPDHGWGGGILNSYFTSPTIINCMLFSNAAIQGGGVFNLTFSSASIINCDLLANAASDQGGGCFNMDQSTPRVVNSIIWYTAPDAIAGTDADVSYCIVQGGYDGVGNKNLQPNFVLAPGTGLDGIWGTDDDIEGDFRPAAGSPCIDASDNNAIPADIKTDLLGNPRFKDDPNTIDSGLSDGGPALADIGAIEYQPPFCPADISPVGGDGVVNVTDLLSVINQWGSCPNPPLPCRADINGDGVVNVTDLLAIINAWGGC